MTKVKTYSELVEGLPKRRNSKHQEFLRVLKSPKTKKSYGEEQETEGKGEKARRPYKITGMGREALKDYEKFRSEWLEGVSQLREMWL